MTLVSQVKMASKDLQAPQGTKVRQVYRASWGQQDQGEKKGCKDNQGPLALQVCRTPSNKREA